MILQANRRISRGGVNSNVLSAEGYSASPLLPLPTSTSQSIDRRARAGQCPDRCFRRKEVARGSRNGLRPFRPPTSLLSFLRDKIDSLQSGRLCRPLHLLLDAIITASCFVTSPVSFTPPRRRLLHIVSVGSAVHPCGATSKVNSYPQVIFLVFLPLSCRMGEMPRPALPSLTWPSMKPMQKTHDVNYKDDGTEAGIWGSRLSTTCAERKRRKGDYRNTEPWKIRGYRNDTV